MVPVMQMRIVGMACSRMYALNKQIFLTQHISSARTAAPQVLAPMSVLAWRAGTGLAPCHICAGTGLTPAHIFAGTGLTPATSSPGLGLPRPHLRRDLAYPGLICAGTGLACS